MWLTGAYRGGALNLGLSRGVSKNNALSTFAYSATATPHDKLACLFFAGRCGGLRVKFLHDPHSANTVHRREQSAVGHLRLVSSRWQLCEDRARNSGAYRDLQKHTAEAKLE